MDDDAELMRDVNDEKKERWRFHMSTKFEKTDVNSFRLSNGCVVSREAIIGVRKCCEPLSWVSTLISFERTE